MKEQFDEEPRIGYKVLTKYNGKLYSFALGRVGGTKDVSKRLLKYNKTTITKGKPWIALFLTKSTAEEFVSPLLPSHNCFKIYKVEYTPYTDKIHFVEWNNFYNALMISESFKKLKSFLKSHYITHIHYPRGTVFADKVKLIQEVEHADFTILQPGHD